MKNLIDLSCDEAKEHFLKGSSYFNGDFPEYISFEPILRGVSMVLGGGAYSDFTNSTVHPKHLMGVNYSFVANKDGRFAWRPYELMHPVLYVSLVNLLCTETNWPFVVDRLKSFQNGAVTCCSLPMVSTDHQSDVATQIRSWWQQVEQQSLIYSLEFSHVLNTDVTDCYGSLYTHSIAWALHTKEVAKASQGRRSLMGNQVDAIIRAGRHGQTNGIPQGSVLMDFIAELVLGYVDDLISKRLEGATDFRILRYKDDYRIFTNSDVRAEEILKVVSDELRTVGMRLGVAKTSISTNVVEGSIKEDKLAGIDLQDLGEANAKTIQKQLLRLHSFGRKYPNSGALRRLVGELHAKIVKQTDRLEDLEVQVAIATDIAVVSPQTFPAVAGILSHLISLQPRERKVELWNRVYKKMSTVPYNGYLEVWLQRVTKPRAVGIEYAGKEALCHVVNRTDAQIWDNSWIDSAALLSALDVKKIVVKEASDTPEVMMPEEVELFQKNAWQY